MNMMIESILKTAAVTAAQAAVAAALIVGLHFVSLALDKIF